MLLNKINVLDKGFVALLTSNMPGSQLQDVQNEYFKSKINMKLIDLCSATVVIKCPLFVQLNLSQFGFNIISTPSDDVEAYIPDVGEIEGDSLADRQRMAQYIKATTEALLLNQKGMPMDGADDLTSQLLTPISIYNEIIVHGSLRQWVNYLKQTKLPPSLEIYVTTLTGLLSVEWGNLPKLLKTI